MKRFLLQHKLTLLMGVILLVALPLAVVLSGQTQIFRPRATIFDTPQSTLTLTPSNSAPAIGEEFTVSLQVDSTQDTNFVITGIDAIFSYPADKLEAIEITGPAELTRKDIDTANHLIYISGQVTSLSDGSGYPQGIASGEVAIIRFKALAEGAAQLSFNYTNPSDTTDSNIIGMRKDVLVNQQSPRERLLTAPQTSSVNIAPPPPNLCWNQVSSLADGSLAYPVCPKIYSYNPNPGGGCAGSGTRSLTDAEKTEYDKWVAAGRLVTSLPSGCIGVLTGISLVPSPSEVNKTDIRVTFNRNLYQDPSMAPSATDWIALFPAGATDRDNYLSWIYTNGTQDNTTTLTTEGSIKFNSVEPGDYIIRFYLNNTRDTKIDEQPISVKLPYSCAETTNQPETGAIPLDVNLYADGSANLPGNSISGYKWDFEGDGIWDNEATPSATNPLVHTYSTPGSFTPKYKLVGSDGSISQACDYPFVVQVNAPVHLKSLTLQVKFNGIDQDRGPITSSVQIGSATDSNSLRLFDGPVIFTHNQNGIYQGVISNFSLAGTAYPPLSQHSWIAIKGAKHARRVFANLSFPDEDTTLDLTPKLLEPGDLPLGGTQDGTINSFDIDKVVSAMAKLPQTEDDLIADVNYDGKVNAIDLGLILRTLSTKPDESLPVIP